MDMLQRVVMRHFAKRVADRWEAKQSERRVAERVLSNDRE